MMNYIELLGKTDCSRWQDYKRCRNAYMIDIRNEKEIYEKTRLQSLASDSKRPKQWWKLLKEFGKMGKRNESIPTLKQRNFVISDDREKAEMFNTLFQSVSSLDEPGVTAPIYFRYIQSLWS